MLLPRRDGHMLGLPKGCRRDARSKGRSPLGTARWEPLPRSLTNQGRPARGLKCPIVQDSRLGFESRNALLLNVQLGSKPSDLLLMSAQRGPRCGEEQHAFGTLEFA